MQRRRGDEQIRLRIGVLTARMRFSNIGRTLCVSQSLSSPRRVASSSNSIPNRISAKVTALA